jgi:hypothetical protein
MEVSISEKDIINKKLDTLVFLLPTIEDPESDTINLQIEALNEEKWITIVDIDKGKALQIDPYLVTKKDDGLHTFTILIGDDQA